MLTNTDMTPNRYAKWAHARRKVAWIKEQLQAGRTVYITTYTKATAYQRKHIDMFKATRSGAFVQSGKKWVCIDFTKITAG